MKIFPSAIAIIALSTLSLQAQNKPLPSAPEPKPTAASERLEGLKKKTDSDKRSIVTNVAFRNVGPTIMSGRVVDIDVNPADPTQFYVAYASGGVWFTGNNGTSFTPVFDGQQAINIGDIAVDWKAATPVIWVGTGESNSSRSSYAGTGIYKSTDGGKTWINKGLPESHHIGKVIIDKNDPNTVYVAVIGHLYSPNKDRGLYKSKDGGETWNQVLFVNENTGIIDAFQDPNDPKTMYAISWHRERRAWNFVEGGTTSGIYKSVDYGATWTSITGAGSNFPSSEYTGRIGLSIAPQNSNILYAVVDNQQINPDAAKGKSDELKPADFRKMTRDEFLRLPQEKVKAYLTDNRFPEKYSVKYVFDKIQKGTLQPVALADFVSDANNDLFNRPIIGAEVYRSDDAGKSWKKTNKSSIDLMFFTYGYYFGKIYVSPFDVNEVYILGVSMQMSKDGGKTFAPIDGDNQHGDHHALWMNPSRRGHLINGNDGGMNLSWDNGQSWMKCNTPAVGQFYAINVDMATPYNVYGGLQDNGVWTGPSTYKASTEWHGEGQYPYKRLLGGDGMQVMIDPRDNNTVYTGYQFGHYYRVDKTTGDMHSIRPQMELGDQPLRFNWQAPIWLSVHNPDIVYFASQHLHRSMDQGKTFRKISGDLTRGGKTGDVPYGTISTIHESPLKFGLIYTGSDDGLIHVTKDGGNTWTRISDKLPQHMRVNRIIASAHAEGRVYAVLSGFQWDHFNAYVYRSDDYGNTWTPIGTDLPMEPVNVIREDPVNENLLFIGTDNGLYVSFDRGKTTMRMFNNLPAVAIHDLVIHPREKDLIVGTHGRSVYIANIAALEQLNDSIMSKDLFVYDLNPIRQYNNYVEDDGKYKVFTATKLNLTYFSGKNEPHTVTVYTGDGGQKLTVLRDTSERGVNFINTELTVDSAYAANYKEWCKTSGIEDKPAETEHGKLSFVQGEYLIEVRSASGLISSKKVRILKPRM